MHIQTSSYVLPHHPQQTLGWGVGIQEHLEQLMDRAHIRSYQNYFKKHRNMLSTSLYGQTLSQQLKGTDNCMLRSLEESVVRLSVCALVFICMQDYLFTIHFLSRGQMWREACLFLYKERDRS